VAIQAELDVHCLIGLADSVFERYANIM